MIDWRRWRWWWRWCDWRGCCGGRPAPANAARTTHDPSSDWGTSPLGRFRAHSPRHENQGGTRNCQQRTCRAWKEIGTRDRTKVSSIMSGDQGQGDAQSTGGAYAWHWNGHAEVSQLSPSQPAWQWHLPSRHKPWALQPPLHDSSASTSGCQFCQKKAAPPETAASSSMILEGFYPQLRTGRGATRAVKGGGCG